MGQVYRAFDSATDRVVALKVLRSDASDNTAFQQRFRRESHTAAGLTDPHVVPIHGYGEIDGRLYLDMRLIEGRDLAHILQESDQPLDPAQAVHYIEQVAEALDAAHRAGLVHRDVKPSNIIITPRDFVYLIDFGIAQAVNDTRLTSTGSAIGTFAYMAPERISAGQSEPRSDVYSLACVLHECLTGQPPFGGDSVEQQIAAHLMTAPPRPSEIRRAVPASFDAVIANGMAKDPDARYQTAPELAGAAREAITNRPSTGHRGNSVRVPQVPTQLAETKPAERPRVDRASTSSAIEKPWHATSKKQTQRRETAKRQLERQLEQRAQQMRRRRNLFIASVFGILVAGLMVWGVFLNTGSDQKPTVSRTTTSVPTTQDAAMTQAGVLPPFNPPSDLGTNCTYQPAPNQPAAKPVDPPKAGKVSTDPASISMSIATNQGPFGVQLDNAKAPCTVNSFASLAQKGFYNDTHCHRLTTGPALSVLQCGDPKGDGTGGPGYQFADEYPSNQYLPDDPARSQPIVYPRGTLAMANSGPGTNGSQFFIVYKDSRLPPNYTVFGKVDEKDMGVIDKIANAGTVDGSPDGKPKTDVVITSARLD